MASYITRSNVARSLSLLFIREFLYSQSLQVAGGSGWGTRACAGERAAAAAAAAAAGLVYSQFERHVLLHIAARRLHVRLHLQHQARHGQHDVRPARKQRASSYRQGEWTTPGVPAPAKQGKAHVLERHGRAPVLHQPRGDLRVVAGRLAADADVLVAPHARVDGHLGQLQHLYHTIRAGCVCVRSKSIGVERRPARTATTSKTYETILSWPH